jgi:hypothetical protein
MSHEAKHKPRSDPPEVLFFLLAVLLFLPVLAARPFRDLPALANAAAFVTRSLLLLLLLLLLWNISLLIFTGSCWFMVTARQKHGQRQQGTVQ